MEPIEAANSGDAPPRGAEMYALHPEEAEPRARRPRPYAPRKPSLIAIYLALTASAFWAGAAAAFIWGYFGKDGLIALPLHWQALIAGAVSVPIVLVWLLAIVSRRAEALRLTGEELAAIAARLAEPEDAAAREIVRIGRAVRREIDALNAGLENALGRAHALETVVDERTSAIEKTSAEVAGRVDSVRDALREERERLGELAQNLKSEAAIIAEGVGQRVAAVRHLSHQAAEDLKHVTAALDRQIEAFGHAGTDAAEQARKFEASSEDALRRAEQLYERHERQRAALIDAVDRIREQSENLHGALEEQRTGLERLAETLNQHSTRAENAAADGARRFEALANSLSLRVEQIAANFARETERAKGSGEQANAALEAAARAVQDAAERSRIAISAESKEAARAFDEAAASAVTAGARLNETLASMRVAASAASGTVDNATNRLRDMIANLPGEAGDHAERIRAVLEHEVAALIALSDRLIATGREIKSLSSPPPPPEKNGGEETPAERQHKRSWLGFARKIAGKPDREEPRSFQLQNVLEAADRAHAKETNERQPLHAMSLRIVDSLEALAIDLDRALGDDPPPELWKRYVAGDRSAYTRRLLGLLTADARERMARQYQDDAEFRDFADRYMAQFEKLLDEAMRNDREMILAETYLTSRTGKLYLVLAAAANRLD